MRTVYFRLGVLHPLHRLLHLLQEGGSCGNSGARLILCLHHLSLLVFKSTPLIVKLVLDRCNLVDPTLPGIQCILILLQVGLDVFFKLPLRRLDAVDDLLSCGLKSLYISKCG